MGIYTNGVIYGFSILVEGFTYRQVYENPVSLENINHFREAYNLLTEEQLNNAIFSFYCEFSSTFEDSKPFISSYPVSKEYVLSYLTKSELALAS
jgi:hypothetical protein